jgi:1-pyrroline-5-carboxylate dehydrogenase
MWNSKIDVPLYIGAKKLELEILEPCPHHDHKHIVGTYHLAEKPHIEKAIANALESRVHGQHGLNSELPFS